MQTYTPSAAKLGTVPIFAQTDAFDAGTSPGYNGTANQPIKPLANGIAWLNGQLQAPDVTFMSNSGGSTLNPSASDLLSKVLLVQLNVSSNVKVNIPTSALTPGDIIRVYAYSNAYYDRPVNIDVGSGGVILNGSPLGQGTQAFTLYAGEYVMLRFMGTVFPVDQFQVIEHRGKNYDVGKIEIAYTYDPRYSISPDGTTQSRAQYPRLWAYINWHITNSTGIVISDSAWLAGGGINQQLFSSGDGSTTFRTPNCHANAIFLGNDALQPWLVY